jgi:glycosyltransferase involved in cell wall biosynthesis
MRITCEISTKNRYEILSQALLSLALQTFKDFDLLIFDDSDQPPRDANELVQKFPSYGQVFQLFQEHKIAWQVVYGQKRGQHYSHQAAQKIAKTDWVFRFDDDEVLEPDVLKRLVYHVREDVGAVAGLVLPPAPLPLPPEAANIISDLGRPNIQWFTQPPQE